LILKQGKPAERRRRKITGLQGAKPGAPGQRDHQEIDMATSVSTTPDFAKPPSGSIPPHAPRTAAANAASAAKAPPPAAGSEQKPAFLDAAECAAWLARVPLANVSLAQPILLRQLNLLHRHELPPGERFAILEALRQPVIEVQAAAAEHLRRPAAAPGQPGAGRAGTHAGPLEHPGAGLPALLHRAVRCERRRNLPLTALLAQRALAAFADWQVDLCRGEQLPDAAYWRDLHQVIAVAEALGITETAVSDPCATAARRPARWPPTPNATC
jgi:hypothetical protein